MVARQQRRTGTLRAAEALVRLAGLLVPAHRRADWQREWLAELWHLDQSLSGEGEVSAQARAAFLLRAMGALGDAIQLRAGSVEDWRASFVVVAARWRRRSGAVSVALILLSIGIAAESLLISFTRTMVSAPASDWSRLASGTPAALLCIAAGAGVMLLVASAASAMRLLALAEGRHDDAEHTSTAELALVAGTTAWIAHGFAWYGMRAIPGELGIWTAPPGFERMVTEAWLAMWLVALMLLAGMRSRRRKASPGLRPLSASH